MSSGKPSLLFPFDIAKEMEINKSKSSCFFLISWEKLKNEQKGEKGRNFNQI